MSPRPLRHKPNMLLRALFGVLITAALAVLVPGQLCQLGADAWFNGDAERQTLLSRGAAYWLNQPIQSIDFHTGSDTFDGEWRFGADMMLAMGLAQVAIEHPDLRDRHAEWVGECIDRLLEPATRQFDTDEWSADALDTLDGPQGHAAYLGYLNLALGMDRLLTPDSRHAAMHDRITESLIRRIRASPRVLLETYPDEIYPVDNAAVIASIALHQRATGANHRATINRWIDYCRANLIDSESGVLFQAVDSLTGDPTDAPRGSGTTLAIYFLSFVDSDLSAELYASLKAHLGMNLAGFGAVREYPAGRDGPEDIDSGLVVSGMGLSATGFTLGGARAHEDKAMFARLYASTRWVGVPHRESREMRYVFGGPLGDSIMLAMLTAQPAAHWRDEPQREVEPEERTP